jgi:hypothetical protein
MGNHNFKKTHLPPGTIVTVVHDKFTRSEELPDSMLKIGSVAKVVKTFDMIKSRPTAKDITLSKITFKDGSSNLYLTTNLAPRTGTGAGAPQGSPERASRVRPPVSH